MVLLIAARSPRLPARPLLVGAAALLATLALDNKVQAIFLIAALPLLLLPFGEPAERDDFWSGLRAGWTLGVFAALALLAAAAAAPSGAARAFPADPASFATEHRVFAAGTFQAMLAVWIGLGVAAFALVWRVPLAEGLAAAALIIGGVALGLLPLYVHRETSVVATVINPLDAMLLVRLRPGGTLRRRRLRPPARAVFSQPVGHGSLSHVFPAHIAAAGNFPRMVRDRRHRLRRVTPRRA